MGMCVIPVLFPGATTAAEDVCGIWLNQSKVAVSLVDGMFTSGMLQQSSLGNKRSSVGITRFSGSHFFPLGSGSGSRAGSIKSDTLSSTSSDPEYIMQLVSDVRKFADVLLHLKEAFNSKGELLFAVFHCLFTMIKKPQKFSVSKFCGGTPNVLSCKVIAVVEPSVFLVPKVSQWLQL